MGKTMDDSSYGVAKAGVLSSPVTLASQVIIRSMASVNSISPGYCYSPNLHDGLVPRDPGLL